LPGIALVAREQAAHRPDRQARDKQAQATVGCGLQVQAPARACCTGLPRGPASNVHVAADVLFCQLGGEREVSVHVSS
jgi:hypothetical protein